MWRYVVVGTTLGVVVLAILAVLHWCFGVIVIVWPYSLYVMLLAIAGVLSLPLYVMVKFFGGIENILNRKAAEVEKGRDELRKNPRTMLRDENKHFRREAARILGEEKDYGAVQLLGNALHDEDEEVGHLAAWALGEIGGSEAVGPLVDALDCDIKDVRRGAAMALGKIADAAAMNSLRTTMESDEDESVRQAASWAIRQME